MLTDTREPGPGQDGQAPTPSAQERTTYLFIVRHGQTEWNRKGVLAGRMPGVHLNERGREQAARIAQLLRAQPISAIYSSPLERCVETAAPLAEALDLPIQEEPGLLEVDFGDWEGGDLKELSKRTEWSLVQVYPSGFRFPGGETLREVQSRVVATLERIRGDHAGQAVAVFAHGDVIRTALAFYLGIPLDLFQRIQIDNGSVSLLAFHRYGPRLLRMNETGEVPVVQWPEEKAEKVAD